ncbi:LpqB family beta-propeller domain-containing protein [Streptomyces sp. NPDC057445]|uniref:LpqB family beta-propeller domain-containing protein n=1 Tax=Streptomyces sp. NPDC057445 TaxID=3346136 RepID=UPI0036BC848E
MGAERRGYGRGRAARAFVLPVCALMLLAGCASMPDSGDVEQVKATKGADSQVRVLAVPPREGAVPEEIVVGFLEAMTSDDPTFATARKYLTKHAAKEWKPEQLTTVLTEAPDLGPAASGENENSRSYPLSGELIATVDRHAYQAVAPTQYSGGLRLVRQSGPDGKGKEWRIDSAPQGLVLGESDFQRNYVSVNKYYFASGQSVVADPVYIRQRQDPVTRMDPAAQAVSALFDGPTNWLRPAVGSPFPAGTALRKGTTSLTPDDQNVLKVPLNGKASNVGRTACQRMATLVLLTLRELTSPRVEQAQLQRADGSPLCVLSADQAEASAPVRASASPDNVYFVDGNGRMSVVGAEAKTVDKTTVRGPFGTGELRLGTVAVARNAQRAAAVTNDGQHLYTSSIMSDEELAAPLVNSAARKPEDRLSAPSWDRNDLWVADRDPARPKLMRLAGGKGDPQTVEVDGLDGARIESLRVSADGVRIALLLSKDGRSSLKIGRIERHANAEGAVTVSVVELQSAAPRLESVTAVSWAGPSRLVVVGKEAGGVQQVRYIATDGSLSPVGGLPGLNKVTAVAATEDHEERPLVAVSDDGLVRLAPSANWQTMIDKGSSPVYPG